MIPHIVFDPAETGYFPGPDRWACAEHTADAPTVPRTSGICQPPVHALAVERIVEVAADRGGAADAAVDTWLTAGLSEAARLAPLPRASARPDRHGLLTIYHGWESGMDNSPRWDEAYSRVTVGPDLPAYQRRDTRIVTDASQRPSTLEYDRYLWIVEQLKRARLRRRADSGVGQLSRHRRLHVRGLRGGQRRIGRAGRVARGSRGRRAARLRRSLPPRCRGGGGRRHRDWRWTETSGQGPCWPRKRSPGSRRCSAGASTPPPRAGWSTC